jgi:HSP20 family protein
MAKENRSFFERLTGAMRVDEYEDEEENTKSPEPAHNNKDWVTETEEEGELTVDVYQTESEIIIKTMVAGVKPEDLDVSITRDMVSIKGKREVERTVDDNDYLHKELYWGSFSRTIVLPQEIDVDLAEAVEKHGLLILKLPKLNKNRQTKVKVRG